MFCLKKKLLPSHGEPNNFHSLWKALSYGTTHRQSKYKIYHNLLITILSIQLDVIIIFIKITKRQVHILQVQYYNNRERNTQTLSVCFCLKNLVVSSNKHACNVTVYSNDLYSNKFIPLLMEIPSMIFHLSIQINF